MFSFLKKKEAIPPPSPLPPGEAFQDPFAEEIDWTPLSLRRDDVLFSLHLFKEDPQRLKYGNSLHTLVRDRLMRVYCAVIAFGVFFFEMVAFLEDKRDWELGDIYALWGVRLFWAFIISSIVYLAWKDWSKFIFDKSMGYYWRGRGFNSVMTNPNLLKTAHPLEDIYALQLLRGIGVNKEDFYELNLVTRDGKRQTIDARVLLTDTQKIAQELAAFLEVPLWDRSDVQVKPKDKVAVFFKKQLEKRYRKPS